VCIREWGRLIVKSIGQPDLVVHIYNPSTWEAEVVITRVCSQPKLDSETLSQQNRKKTKRLLMVHGELLITYPRLRSPQEYEWNLCSSHAYPYADKKRTLEALALTNGM
jgi:hypothetical protein